MGAAQRWWLHHSLASLGRDIAARGGRLILRRGRAGPIVQAMAGALGADVHTLVHHEPWATVQVRAARALATPVYAGFEINIRARTKGMTTHRRNLLSLVDDVKMLLRPRQET